MDKRFSYQRQVILKTLQSMTSHPNAEELYKVVKERIPNISLATVYRNLNEMAENGQILRLSTPLSATCFEGNVQPHAHLVCRKCHKVKDAFVHWSHLSEDITEYTDSQILDVEVIFTVICPQCLAEEANNIETKEEENNVQ